MPDEPVATEIRKEAGPTGWFERLATAKLSVPILLGFFLLLAMFSAAATGVSFLVHHLIRH